MDCGPPNSSVHGILQTRILEWVAVSFCYGIGRVKEDSLLWASVLGKNTKDKVASNFFIHVDLSTEQVTKHSSLLRES